MNQKLKKGLAAAAFAAVAGVTLGGCSSQPNPTITDFKQAAQHFMHSQQWADHPVMTGMKYSPNSFKGFAYDFSYTNGEVPHKVTERCMGFTAANITCSILKLQ